MDIKKYEKYEESIRKFIMPAFFRKPLCKDVAIGAVFYDEKQDLYVTETAWELLKLKHFLGVLVLTT